jgi:hypothetical protein
VHYPYAAIAAGILLAVVVFVLLRRDKLYVRDAVFWLAVAAASIVFGIYPRSVEWIGKSVAESPVPVLFLSTICGVLTIKSLVADIALTTLRRDVRRLNQRIAMTESEKV